MRRTTVPRALTVPRGPKWVCDNCHTVHGEWAAICGNCGAFDTLSWTEPQEGTVALPSQSEMLPLIVGPSDNVQPEIEEDTAQTADPAPASRTGNHRGSTPGTCNTR